MFFVKLGGRTVGVTAAHVHRKVCRLRARDQTPWCQVGGHTFSPEVALLDIDDALDIATYSISDVALSAIGGHAHDPPAWPPLVSEHDLILPSGFPSALSQAGPNEGTHMHVWFACRAQVSGEDQLGAPSFTRTSVPVGAQGLPPDTPLYGMSGGPVFRLEEDGLSTMTIVGLVHEYHEQFEIFLIRPLTRILTDGRIRRDGAEDA